MKTKLTLLLAFIAMSMSVLAANQTISVKTADEFVRALGPDRTIVIATTAPLNVTEAIDKMIALGHLNEGPTYYNPETAGTVTSTVTYGGNTDGNGLQVRGCENLTIRAKKGMATLLATPRYVNVLEFIHCNNIKLENIVMGHTEGGYCDKGVIEFDGCTNILINDCDFFGCGTEGFVFENCNHVSVNRSCVHDCTYYTMHITGCQQVRFNDCTFRNNKEYNQLNVQVSNDVAFTGCVFDCLEGEMFNFDEYVGFYNCVFRNCQVEPISSRFAPQGSAVLAYCTTMFGDAPVGKPDAAKPKFKLGRWTDGTSTYILTQVEPYRYLFTSVDDPSEAFAVNCFSAQENDYMTGSEFPFTNTVGCLSVDIIKKDGKDYIRILDDGHEPIKSFFYLGKK